MLSPCPHLKIQTKKQKLPHHDGITTTNNNKKPCKVLTRERGLKNKMCCCLPRPLCSFLSKTNVICDPIALPVFSKIFEFSRLKLETKATPTKLRVCHAPSHKQNKQTNKQKRKKQKYTVANVQTKG